MTRFIPTILIKFLEREEGEQSMPYRDSAGVLTVGVGHTGSDVRGGVEWTQAQIDAALSADLQMAVQRLTWAIGPDAVAKLNDYQFSALVSFCFNEGAGASWAVWADLRKGDYVDVPAELTRFVYAGGQVVQGLVNRRAAEIALWNGTDPLCAAYPLQPD